MHPDVEKLVALQGLDLEAKRLRDEMVALPKLVSALETQASNTFGQRAVVLELQAKEDALRRRQQSDVKDLQAKIVRGRAKAANAVDAVQATAFEREIAFAQGEIAKIEDAELESMERSELLDAQKVVADRAVDLAEEKLQRERQRAVERVASDKVLLVDVERERIARRAQIDGAVLSTYDRIAKGKGTGVAEAAHQKCSACQMMVRPQKWNDLREPDNTEIMSCESCGRLLFYDRTRDSPERKTVPVESIAASIVRSL